MYRTPAAHHHYRAPSPPPHRHPSKHEGYSDPYREHHTAYHPYRPRSIYYQPAPRHPSPPRQQHRPKSSSLVLPPIDTLTSPRSRVAAPPPLGSRPHTAGHPSTRRTSDASRQQQRPSYHPRAPTPPRYHPYSPPTTRVPPRPVIKQEPREYRYAESLPRRPSDDYPLTPVSIHFPSPAMIPIDHSDAHRASLDRLHIVDDDVKPEYDMRVRAMSPAERQFFQTMPRSSNVVAYPVQYQWPAGAAVDGATDASADSKLPIDPALSSVRSSAGVQQNLDVNMAPEIRLQPETLGSAAASPGLDDKDDGMLAPGDKKDTPFSRSPELRISHKLAERKRRKEMRELFEELREQLPADRGMKASKWEILSKAVDYIQHLKTQVGDATRTIELLHRDMATLRGQDPQNAAAWTSGYHNFNLPYVPHAGSNTTTPAPAAVPAAQPQAQPQQLAAAVPAQAAPAPGTPQPAPAVQAPAAQPAQAQAKPA